MAVRMQDVAARAGVTAATVSLALSGSTRISAATRERVTRIAEEMGYRPHVGAQALRTDSTRSIGLIVSDVANPFFADLAGEIQRAAARHRYSLVLCNSDEDPDRQDDYLAALLAGRRVDGVIVVPTAAMTPGLRQAGATRARIVLLDRPVALTSRDAATKHLAQSPIVRSDAREALDEVAELLTGLGHRRIGIIAPPLQTQVGQERRDLLVDALVRRGVPRRSITVAEGDFRQDSGATATAQLLARRQPPTAIFAADGLMAVGALKGLRSAGLQVPRDVSLVGFDDAPWFDLFDPPLTAIAQPIVALASAAVDAMLALLAGESALGSQPACQLVHRGSCGPAATGRAA
ncbi:LacI family transcriptional regulator [Mycolicibacterium cosmeticum]|uniref:Ribose operon repressor n=1 Tax=Mycolicibacterium cosmeticum TaxID=258533 RepID=W9BL37_MYCCO|nr:LacI family DNA-binding transcriptional regulator [Mycolicibacterium cosmeticum]TLH73191.1 LacI family transcriptional regulator [Mycolicibacterium cosmeticum]CDO08970.1 ribose operon repressor [Mycolicibacterium cosmeticum]